MVVVVVCVVVFLTLLFFHLLTRRYVNPYTLKFIFGKKGSGKSTLLAKDAFFYQKMGRPCYSTENIPGCYKITYEDIGKAEFPPGSVILIDEAGMVWDNRNFAHFPPEVRDWFKLQRHRKVTVILASQTFDIDKKLRDLTDEMYIVSKYFRVFSYAKRVSRRPCIVEATSAGESKITENYEIDPFILFPFGSRRVSFIPRWAKYFDSFTAPALPQKSFVITPYPPGLKRPRVKKKSSNHLLRLIPHRLLKKCQKKLPK